ncbi:Aspartic proteinase nepenthesin-1 precursor, putative [Ricinus communis]|uniref:Aspartic proteinase nepenthesin-1, putative n=1 Tax=Ricinus communis TaxID=3988 RepID=B9RBP1_RICCO|nr:Aspartic proteinase nepenthesin-1 precursor, putative [Ricinus communis]|eukprot:XP_002509575.1 aspartic proteinase CDR1 [Ricinus communis]
MEVTSSFTLKSFLLTFTITLLSLALTTNTKPNKPVTTKLIHRDSIFSPAYNPNDSIKDRAKRMLKNSNARFDYVQAISKRNSAVVDYDGGDTSAADDAYEASLLSELCTFLVNFSIGQPPVPQYAVMDTGSSLTWIQCEPCINCHQQKGPLYNPSSSSTYVSCSDFDRTDTTFTATHGSDCNYSQTYADKTTTRGTYAREQLLFETPDDGITIMHDVIFGCGHNNTQLPGPTGYASGVFGLGDSGSSIISKLGFGFSYCIGNIGDPLYGFHRLTLGNKLKIEGYSTPLVPRGLYYITLVGISIGQERLDIDPIVFQRVDLNGISSRIVIDSGATLSYIPRQAYNVVRDKVSSILSGFLSRYRYIARHLSLCYIGKLNQDLQGFPDATFHLADGADLVFQVEGLFFQYTDNVLCLALVPTESDEETCLIGLLAQQYYNVAYDLKQQKLYFQRIECELLDD